MNPTAWITTLSLLLALAIGCGKKDDDASKAPPAPPAQPAQPAQPAADPAATGVAELPTPEDFEEQAREEITEDGLEKAVQELEEELED